MLKLPHVETLGARAAREGRIARASGVAREANPYGVKSVDGQRHLRDLWWSGWDTIDADLRNPVAARGRHPSAS